MTDQVLSFAVPPVVKTVTVRCTPVVAFRRFTEELSRWWPLDRFHVAADARSCAMEVGLGGRVYERSGDGTETVWGSVVTWEPPHRVAFTWHPGTSEAQAQRIELTFTAIEGDSTRVRLEHTGWEKLGERAATMREAFDGGWATVFERCFVDYADSQLCAGSVATKAVVHGPSGSTYVRSVRLALEEKAVFYDLVPMGPGENRQPAHLARQPFGRVPSFEHDGFALYESQAILRYVDETFAGPRLQPSEPRRRARMNQILGIIDWYGWPSLAAGIVFNRLIAPKLGIPVNEQAVVSALPNAELSLREIDRLAGDAPFLTGETLTLADLMLAPIIAYLPLVPESQAILAKFPRLVAWSGRMAARPSMRATEPKF